MIDFQPTEEQQLIVDTVRQFAANEIRPLARDCAERRALPKDVLASAHELGLVANGIDEAHGGGGERSAITGCLVAEELAFGDLAIALAILSPALVALPIGDCAGAALRDEHLKRYTAAQFLPGALALVEPDIRFDPFAPATRATRDRSGGFDGWRIDGAKCFVPWIEGGTHLIAVASTESGARLFCVPRDAEGLRAEPERNLGIDALPTVELAFDGVRVPDAAAFGSADGSDVRALVARGRVGLAATGVGVARAAYEIARDYAKQREAFGAPIATKQAIAFKLADMAIEIDGARLLAWEAAWKLDRGEDATREATLAYDQVQRVALAVTDGAVQVLGGHGYIRDYLPELHLRNARGYAAFEALTLV